MVARQSNVIIMGDFNYLYIDWVDGTAQSPKARHLLNVNFMCHLVEAPIRNNALLDLLITNKTYLNADVEVRDNEQRSQK